MGKKCIICYTPDNDERFKGPPEHIIPYALGNRELVINDVCVECNKLMGSKLDIVITTSLFASAYREKYALKGHSGSVPSIHKIF